MFRSSTSGRVVGLSSVALLLAACSGSPDLSAESAIFEGLDGAVVQEVLDSPVAFGKVKQMTEDVQASMAQGIVRNFVQCRAAYSAYESWVTTGVAPQAPPVSTPTQPVEPSNETTDRAQAVIESAIASGEPSRLRDFLVGEARCGEWIPVDPGDPEGDTIADAVEALG